MQNENSIAKRLLQNKLLVALVISIAIVATLFYSVPALAFHAGATPTVSYTAGQSNLSVTVEVIKDHADEILLSPDNITASLLYTTGYMADQIPATNCSFGTLTYGNVSGYAYGLNFYGYGYGYNDVTIVQYSNYSGYNFYSGYDFGYGYGNASGSSLYCTFNFNSTYVLNKITVGITTYVNGYNLINSTNPNGASGTLLFTQVIAVQQANGNVSGNNFTANETSTITFSTQDGSIPMNAVMASGTLMTVPDNSSTPGIISIGVVPPESKPSALNDTRTMGPVLELGPAGATFSPAINISFNMSYVKNQSGKTITQLYALYVAGNLKIRKVTGAGVTTDINTTWVGGTSETCSDCMLVASVSSFSSFGTYDSTPAASGTSGSSSGTGGGSVSRPYAAPETTNESVTPTTPTTTPTTTPVAKQKAVISAPSSITAGDTVVLTLTDQYGAPISSATIIVSDPNGNKLEYTTDANGYARFVALVSGTYTYAVRGIELASAPSTTVIAKQKVQQPATPAEQAAQQAAEPQASSPLLGGALFLVGAGAIVLIVLAAVAYLLFVKKGGKKGL